MNDKDLLDTKKIILSKRTMDLYDLNRILDKKSWFQRASFILIGSGMILLGIAVFCKII
jgi:uncharacterized RDD family membrane protein YckC